MDDKSERPSFLIYKSFYEPIKILSYENKENLIEVWETIFSDTWKQDSKIKEMYENKLAELED